jgi:hypothetical protein
MGKSLGPDQGRLLVLRVRAGGRAISATRHLTSFIDQSPRSPIATQAEEVIMAGYVYGCTGE